MVHELRIRGAKTAVKCDLIYVLTRLVSVHKS